MKTADKNPEALIEALRLLLIGRKADTQEAICSTLEKQGYEINQSKVSRLLRKIGATKVVNDRGQTVYSLPREPSPLPINTPIRNLILDIAANETMVIIFTSPGSASMIARALEYSQLTTEILGTIAGDDTIFVAPKSIKNILKLFEDVKRLLRE
jgi:transcriptional regulator of arginine metabolism